MGYPVGRPAFFAQRYIRLLTKTCAAQSAGTNAFALCVIIVTTEDAKRYTGPVTFYNEQLLPILGVRKWESLDRARKAAIESGWLHYEAPPNGASKPGRYWVTIPGDVSEIPDGGCDEGQEPYPENGDGKGDDTLKAYTENGDGMQEPYPLDGDGRGYGGGELSILSLCPKEEESTSVSDSEKKKPANGKKPKSKQSAPDFDPLAVDLPFESVEFHEVWGDWVSHRIEKKKPLTPTMTKQQLKKLAGMGEQAAIKLIELVVEKGWLGLDDHGKAKEAASQPEDKPRDLSTAGIMASMADKGGIRWDQ